MSRENPWSLNMKAEFIKPRNKVDGGKYLSTNRLSVIKCVTNDKVDITESGVVSLSWFGLLNWSQIVYFYRRGEERFLLRIIRLIIITQWS